MQIFFSHSSRDKTLLRELKTHFPRWINVWIDEERLFFGSDLELCLRKTINEDADYVVLFLDHEALNSDWVQREIEWALAREEELQRTFLLPVFLVSDVRKHLTDLKLASRISSRVALHCTDFTKEGVKTLANKIANQIGGWISDRLGHIEKLYRELSSLSQMTDLQTGSRFHQLVKEVADNFNALPAGWQDLVETLVLTPFSQAAARSRRGEILLTSSQYYQCILREIGLAGQGWEVFAVSTLSSDLWSGNTNQKNYAIRNLQAVERGAKICRLFILPEDKESEFMDTIHKQERSGVEIRVADTRLLAETNDLEDVVIFRSPEYVHAYICHPAIDNPKSIRSGRLIFDDELCRAFLSAFHEGWEAAMDADDYQRSKSSEFDKYSPKPLLD